MPNKFCVFVRGVCFYTCVCHHVHHSSAPAVLLYKLIDDCCTTPCLLYGSHAFFGMLESKLQWTLTRSPSRPGTENPTVLPVSVTGKNELMGTFKFYTEQRHVYRTHTTPSHHLAWTCAPGFISARCDSTNYNRSINFHDNARIQVGCTVRCMQCYVV